MGNIVESVEKRVAKLEATVEQYKSGLWDVLKNALDHAVEQGDEETAALVARKLRNQLLSESDNEFTLDRIHPNTDSAAKFVASLKTILEGPWAEYRQALRDLPQQAGFPLNITWPVAPGEEPAADSEETEGAE